MEGRCCNLFSERSLSICHLPRLIFLDFSSNFEKGILLHLGDLGHLDQAGVVEGQLQLGDLPLPCLCEYVADSFLFICIKQCNCFAKKKKMDERIL